MIAEGKKVDFVFGDLTDIPVATSPQGEAWDFIKLILNMSFKVLAPNGKYLTHVSTYLPFLFSQLKQFQYTVLIVYSFKVIHSPIKFCQIRMTR